MKYDGNQSLSKRSRVADQCEHSHLAENFVFTETTNTESTPCHRKTKHLFIPPDYLLCTKGSSRYTSSVHSVSGQCGNFTAPQIN